MGRASATITVPGGAAEAEALWYDPTRWPAWVDGFGHVVKLEGHWPEPDARLVWDSKPGGRGRVLERVTFHVQRHGQTLAVEDERLRGTQQVRFEPAGDDTRVTLSLEYDLKHRTPITPLVDWLFVRRAIRDSLTRTITRFGHEREGDLRPF
jgi:Polyketide cyclase / dehydrase and lipid transport